MNKIEFDEHIATNTHELRLSNVTDNWGHYKSYMRYIVLYLDPKIFENH